MTFLLVFGFDFGFSQISRKGEGQKEKVVNFEGVLLKEITHHEHDNINQILSVILTKGDLLPTIT